MSSTSVANPTWSARGINCLPSIGQIAVAFRPCTKVTAAFTPAPPSVLSTRPRTLIIPARGATHSRETPPLLQLPLQLAGDKLNALTYCPSPASHAPLLRFAAKRGISDHVPSAVS